MKLPEQLESLRDRKIWLCYPLIWNPKKHGGVGGYDKPPVNPYTLFNGMSDNPDSLATYDVAAAQIGKKAKVRVPSRDALIECEIAGVGLAFSGSGVFGVDLDNVLADRAKVTKEAGEIISSLKSYTEISPSGTGLHILCLGSLPSVDKKLAKDKPDIFDTMKAEYQLFDSGYMAISGNVVGNFKLAERTDQIAEVYEKYFREVEPIQTLSRSRPAAAPPVVSYTAGFSYERWLEDVRRLSDAEILERIFLSGSTGKKVEALYRGDTSDYNNDHSRADQALCTYFYGFTSDRALTERLFRSSGLYRVHGKSRKYLDHTLNKAEKDCIRLIGHIEFTTEEKREYAKQKAADDFKDTPRAPDLRRRNSYKEGSVLRRRNSYRGNGK